MRRFSLRNELGETRFLNMESGLFLSNPQGLGVNRAYSFADGDNGFFVCVQDANDPRQQIIGDLVFTGDAYGQYVDLIQWMQKTDTMGI